MKRRAALHIAGAGALAALVPLAAWSQDKTLRIVVPFPAGGSIDALARALAPRLSAALGQTVVVENRPGAAGALGVGSVAKAAPDGQTVVLSSPGAVAINRHFRDMPYDPQKDLAPIGLVATVPTAIAVNANLPIRNMAELIAYARAQKDGMSFSVSGQGSQTHLAGELLASVARVKLEAVPYKGTSPAALAIASGEVPMGISDLTALNPLISAGRIRPIAVVDSRRASMAPNIPTVAESGFSGFSASGWVAMFAPGGTPEPVVQRLHDELRKVMQQAEVVTAVTTAGMEPSVTTPVQLRQFLAEETTKWGKVIKDANIQSQ